jgi:hypothetical protein
VWAHAPWREKVQQVCERTERLVVQIDDDWTELVKED